MSNPSVIEKKGIKITVWVGDIHGPIDGDKLTDDSRHWIEVINFRGTRLNLRFEGSTEDDQLKFLKQGNQPSSNWREELSVPVCAWKTDELSRTSNAQIMRGNVTKLQEIVKSELSWSCEDWDGNYTDPPEIKEILVNI